MQKNRKKFGSLLTEGINQAQIYESKQNRKITKGLLQDEVSEEINAANGNIINHWRQGHIPQEPKYIVGLAIALTQRGSDYEWASAFLTAGGYENSNTLLAELFPERSMVASETTTTVINSADASINNSPFIPPNPLEEDAEYMPAASKSIMANATQVNIHVHQSSVTNSDTNSEISEEYAIQTATIPIELQTPKNKWRIVILISTLTIIVFGGFYLVQSSNQSNEDSLVASVSTSTPKSTLPSTSVPTMLPISVFGETDTSWSHLYFDDQGESLNLDICGDHVSGQTVYAQLSINEDEEPVVSKIADADENCVHFQKLVGTDAAVIGSSYTVRAALNQHPDLSWNPNGCFGTTNGQGLCDTIRYTNSFEGNAFSYVFFDEEGSSIGLGVCGDSIIGQTIYVQLSSPDKIWPAQSAQTNSNSVSCLEFKNLNGDDPLDPTMWYSTKVALNQEPDSEWPDAGCMAYTDAQGLCDTDSFSTRFIGNVFSKPSISEDKSSLDLQVCADSISGKTVYAQLSSPDKTWEPVTIDTDNDTNCVTFEQLNGDDILLPNMQYITRIALEQPPRTHWKGEGCYDASNWRGLCDIIFVADN